MLLSAITSKYASLLRGGVSTQLQYRPFYSWLIEVFNRKDENRVKEVGADRAAAEWIIRNGGQVKFANSITWLTNYVTLPYGKDARLLEIDGSGVSLTSNGLEHLVDLKWLRHLNLTGCRHITHVESLVEVSDTLKYLNLTGCTGIIDFSPILKLSKLESLILIDVMSADERKLFASKVNENIRTCDVIITESPPE